VRLVNAVEFGADANGSRSKSCGETVPMFVELDDERFACGSLMYGTAGEEYAEWNDAFCAEAPPSNAVNSSKRSISCMAMFGVCGMLPVDCENSGT
jgi:hypothetical protein